MIGLGLLYQESGHRRMAEVFLGEMAKFPTTNREGFVLASGIALGWVTLGKGDQLLGLSDLHFENTLLRYIDGGFLREDELEASVRSSENLCVFEGKKINTNSTAPGALLALAMLYLKTNKSSVAERLVPPSTYSLLNPIRPDLHVLRLLCYNLIMWDSIEPTQLWMKSQVPEQLTSLLFSGNRQKAADFDFLETVHIFILAGSCLSLGFKFAGTFSRAAKKLLLSYCSYFKEVYQKEVSKRSNPPLPLLALF